jgi:hypothetical protein
MGFIKKKKKDSTVEGVAKRMISSQLKHIAESDKTESVTMTRQPSEGEGIAIRCEYVGETVNIPFYAYYIVKTMAESLGVSFKHMISLIEAYDDLMPDVSKERSEKQQKEAED